jgi:hypothetical protein
MHFTTLTLVSSTLIISSRMNVTVTSICFSFSTYKNLENFQSLCLVLDIGQNIFLCLKKVGIWIIDFIWVTRLKLVGHSMHYFGTLHMTLDRQPWSFTVVATLVIESHLIDRVPVILLLNPNPLAKRPWVGLTGQMGETHFKPHPQD